LAAPPRHAAPHARPYPLPALGGNYSGAGAPHGGHCVGGPAVRLPAYPPAVRPSPPTATSCGAPTHRRAAAKRPAAATCTGTAADHGAGGGYPYAYPHIHPPYGRRQPLRRPLIPYSGRRRRALCAGGNWAAAYPTHDPTHGDWPAAANCTRTAPQPTPNAQAGSGAKRGGAAKMAAQNCQSGNCQNGRLQSAYPQPYTAVRRPIHPKTRQDGRHAHLSPTAVCETLHICTQ
jgi:hypothetical protein